MNMTIGKASGLLLVGLAFCFLVGCQDSREDRETNNPDTSLEQLGTVDLNPTAIRFGEDTAYLDTAVYGDLMPGDPESGIMVIAAVTATTERFPEGITFESVKLVHGEAAWESVLEVTPIRQGLQARADHGPRWPPGDKVDVFLVMYDHDERKSVVKRDVEIGAAY